LVRALASVQDLRPARERKSSGAADLFRGTSSRWLPGRDLLLDLRGAVVAAQCPKPAGPFQRLFRQQKVDGQ